MTVRTLRAGLGLGYAIVPLVIAAGAVAVNAVHYPALTFNAFREGDASYSPVLAHALAGGHSHLLLGSQPEVVPLLIESGLSRLPGFHVTGPLLGPLVYVIIAMVLARAAWHLGGRRAATVAGALALCVPPVLVWPSLLHTSHNVTLLGDAVLAWHLAAPPAASARRNLMRSLTIGFLCGLFVASDAQFIVAGCVPYAVGVVLLHHDRRTTLRELTRFIVAALAGATASTTAVAALGITIPATFATSLTPGGVVRGITLTLRGLVWMFNGDWYADPIDAHSIPGIVLAAATVTVTLGVVVHGVIGARRDESARTATALRRRGQCVFWLLSALGVTGSLAASGESVLDGQAHYIVGIWYGFAVLLALAIDARFAGRAVPAMFLLIVLVAARAATATADQPPTIYAIGLASADDARLAQALTDHHLTHGYADYWDAYDADWQSRLQLDIWPVSNDANCTGEIPGSLCAYGFNTDVDAYHVTPPPATTFLVLHDRALGCMTRPPSTAIFGPPQSQFRVGEFTVLVYDYDIATRFAPARAPVCVFS